jgi:hypothetical protein
VSIPEPVRFAPSAPAIRVPVNARMMYLG